MITTNTETKSIQYFYGINNFIDPFLLKDFYTEWIEGLYPTIRGELERIKGKQLFTSTTYETIFTIASLEFAYKTVVLIHSGASYLAEEDLSSLQTDDITIKPLETLIPA